MRSVGKSSVRSPLRSPRRMATLFFHYSNLLTRREVTVDSNPSLSAIPKDLDSAFLATGVMLFE
jgi:hypothetical protein